MLNVKNDGSTTAVDIQTVEQQVNEGEMLRMPPVVTGIVAILVRIARKRDGSAASLLFDVIHDRTFYLDIFETNMKNLKYYKEISCKRTEERTKEEGFLQITVRQRRESNHGHGTLSVKNIFKLLQCHIALCG